MEFEARKTLEITSRCWVFTVADHLLSAFQRMLKINNKNPKKLTDMYLTMHFRRIIEHFVIPSQVYAANHPYAVLAALQRVRDLQTVTHNLIYCGPPQISLHVFK